jgi:glycine C-acetyltransferase
MFDRSQVIYEAALADLKRAGLYKEERVLTTPQGARVRTETSPTGSEVLNFCSNNYLGLASDPRVVQAAHRALDRYGFGLSSVRFICGTQSVHRALEQELSSFLGVDDAILYSSCFDANGGLFETLLGDQDAVISDALNHASIIDGIRLCKAERHRYPNGDMDVLENMLRSTAHKRLRLVATDGVFSMDGQLAKLDQICDLAERYDAMVMVDDSHAVGFIGPRGRGTPEYFAVTDRVDLITGTFGKALGGAAGGYTAGRRAAIDLLRQRSRPYLFSNSLAPVIAATSLEILRMLQEDQSAQARLLAHAREFRRAIAELGFQVPEGFHPIVPIMLGDAARTHAMASSLLDHGIYVTGFSYPVVPLGGARIRVQVSAVHEPADIALAVAAFHVVGIQHGVIS